MLEIKNVTFEVDDEKRKIIDDLSLTIDDGKFVVITGPNGGGKSTLAKLIMGVNDITSGKLIFDGEDITDCNITERANKGISFAFQQPVHFKGIKVVDLLRLAAGEKISVAKACEYLSKVGLCAKDYVNREVNAYSFDYGSMYVTENSYGSQSGAIIESTFSDGFNTIGKCHRG